MIKPHGSDKLNPLYVADDAKRTALLKEAESLPSIVVSSAAAGNAVMLGSRVLQPADRLHEQGRLAAGRREAQDHQGPLLAGADREHGQGRLGDQGRQAHRAARPERRRQPGARDQDVEAIEEFSRRRHEDDDREDLPHARPRAPRRRGLQLGRQVRDLRPDPGAELLLLRGGLPGHLPHRDLDPQRDRRARLEQGRRVPDPQPDAPRPRGAVQDGRWRPRRPTAS